MVLETRGCANMRLSRLVFSYLLVCVGIMIIAFSSRAQAAGEKGLEMTYSILRPATLRLDRVNTVAVIGLQGSAADEVAEYLTAKLAAIGRFQVTNRTDLSYDLKDLSFEAEGKVSPAMLNKLRDKLEVDAVVVGKASIEYADKDRKQMASIEAELGFIQLNSGVYQAFERIDFQMPERKTVWINKYINKDRDLDKSLQPFYSQVTPYMDHYVLQFEAPASPDGKMALMEIEGDRLQRGIDKLKDEVKNHPQSAVSWYNLALASILKNDLKTAESALSQAMRIEDREEFTDTFKMIRRHGNEELKLFQQFKNAGLKYIAADYQKPI